MKWSNELILVLMRRNKNTRTCTRIRLYEMFDVKMSMKNANNITIFGASVVNRRSIQCQLDDIVVAGIDLKR